MESRGCFSQLLCCWGESTSQPELTPFTPLPKHREIKHVILRAMYDFKAIEEDDLSFSQGDLLKKENPGDTSAWVVCINMRNGNKGFVPIEYVQLADTSPNGPDWWFDCSRSQAEALLMRYEVAIGSFLVRGSLCQNSVLSIKYLQDAGETQCVFHYKIRLTDGGERCISPRKIFPDLISLVAHYRASLQTIPFPAALGHVHLGLGCPNTSEGNRMSPTEVEIVSHNSTMKIQREHQSE
ncbi:tyrosine-protein kinase HCK-like [Haliotis rufescens]|uniref:tyrosine-protein kinase HCK-like n=1 Tax=Haliotis rufescens TaxID=6454 RepID=UPI00201F329D|nr:tyrosine-protein kinase HCK-like [Haliotis rufescens]